MPVAKEHTPPCSQRRLSSVRRLIAARPWPRQSRERIVPAGFLGMLVLVVAVEAFFMRHDRDFSNVWVEHWKFSGAAARGAAKRSDLLCFGDSLVMCGVVPQVVTESLGQHALNLAISKGQMATSYFLLRRALAAGARPTAVLVDGELLGVNPLEEDRLWPEMATLRECAELAVAGRNASFFAAMVLAKTFASYRDRYEIRAGVLAVLRGETASTRLQLRFHRRNQRVNHGAQVLPFKPVLPTGDPRIAAITAQYVAPTWTCDPLNAQYADRFLELAAQQHLQVFWLLPPVHPEVQARRNRDPYDGAYAAFLARLQDRYANLVVIDGRHSGYGPDQIFDLTHLNRRGACTFSLDLGSTLRQHLAAREKTRWITLPAYRARQVSAPLEDLDQSSVALQQSGARR